VAETLVEIQQGVQLAIKRSKELQTNGVINPVWGTSKDVGGNHIKQVQFDIAVTVSDKSSGNVEGGIKVVGISLGKESGKSEESTHVSRIQFSIPIVPPVTEVHSEH
jgi:hypothetical protein